DDLPAILAISAKVAVGGENDRPVNLLRHADETGVGEAHGSIVIATEEAKRFRELIGEGKIDCDNGALQQPAKRFLAATRALQEEEAFRNDRFTTDKWLRLCLEVCSRPCMMMIASSQRGDDRATIDDDGFGHS